MVLMVLASRLEDLPGGGVGGDGHSKQVVYLPGVGGGDVGPTQQVEKLRGGGGDAGPSQQVHTAGQI